MSISFKKHILYLVSIGFVFSCSTKVNKFPNRAFHSTTTRFNVLFNGEQSFLEGVAKFKESYKEDYDEILPVYIYPNEEKAKDIYPEMNRAIEKASKAIQKHSLYIKKKEHNKYIDDAYFLMGKAHFYKRDYADANEMFSYLAKSYKKELIGYQSSIWQVKVLLEQQKPDKADEALRKINEDKKLPKELITEFKAVYADYYIREKNYALAITELKEAIENTKKKKDKIRYTFIIAQLYEALGNNSFAVEYYDMVIDMKPSFEVAFYSKTKKAFSSEGSKSMKETEAELYKLLKRTTNDGQKSLIYVALAEIELKKGRLEKTFEYLAKASVFADDKKAHKKVYAKTAQIYYDQRDYINAQIYYDSTIQVMDKIDPLYEQTLVRRNVLTKLSNNFKIIENEDSLQTIAKMSESDRMKKINEIIEQKKRQAEEEKLAKENAKKAPATTNTNSDPSSNNWYFANSNTVNFGISEFQKIWGKRTLEDNWRRKNKAFSFADETEPLVENLNIKPEVNMTDSPQVYLKNLPLTPELMVASESKKINAYYNLGLLYKDDLKEPESAIEDFKVIVEQYDTSKYSPNSYYYLYSLYKELGKEDRANQYRDLLIQKYPETEFAKIAKNPNYLLDKQKLEKAVFPYYESAFNEYKKKEFESAILKAQVADSMFPNNPLKAKFHFLMGMSHNSLNRKDKFIQELQFIVDQFPKSDEGKEATIILKKLKDYKPPKEKDVAKDTLTGNFIFNEKEEHQSILLIPIADVNMNEISNLISDFNTKNFSLIPLSISSIIFNDQFQLLKISKFPSSVEALVYYEAFNNNPDLKKIKDSKITHYIISNPNYAELYKKKDVASYEVFFNASYLKK